MEPVKGSREISLRNAALRSVSRLKRRPLIGQARGQLRLTWRSYAGPPQSVSHGVSFRRLPSYTLSRCAGLPLKGKQDVTGLPSCFLSTLNILLNWPPWAAPPYPALPDSPPKGKRLTTFCASLSLLQNVFAVHPRESVSHDSQVALLPYSTAITDSQYFARHCVPSKYVRWCDSCSLATPSGEQNKPLYVPPQSHVARW